jgi:hypothetical protein
MKCISVLVAIASVAWAQVPSVPPSFAGTWVLNAERSDAIDAAAEVLKVDAMTRPFMPKKPEQMIQIGPGTLTVSSKAAKRTETFTLDGITPTSVNLFNASGSVTARLDGEAVVLAGTLSVEDKPLRFVSRRTVVGDEMTVVTQLGETVTFTRRFWRKR